MISPLSALFSLEIFAGFDLSSLSIGRIKVKYRGVRLSLDSLTLLGQMEYSIKFDIVTPGVFIVYC